MKKLTSTRLIVLLLFSFILISSSQADAPAVPPADDDLRESSQKDLPAETSNEASSIADAKKKLSKITIENSRIYVDDKLFFIKGICYGPFYPDKGFTKHAYMKFPEGMKEKDFELMKEAGFNTIRLYENMPDDFYDYAAQYGFKVIEPVMWPGHYTNIENPDVFEDLVKTAVERVEHLKNHPSILMWSMWNDAPFHKTNIVEKFGQEKVDAFFKKIYEKIKAADPDHPVTGANMINAKNGWDMGFTFLDVIGCNSYIGLDYNEDAWKASRFRKKEAMKRVQLMYGVSKKLNKPVFITEMGCSTHPKYSQQGQVISHQIAIVAQRLAGYCLFEFTDEWWKAGKNDSQEAELEEHWGLCDAYRKPKPGYETVKKFFNVIPTESKGLNREMLDSILNKQ